MEFRMTDQGLQTSTEFNTLNISSDEDHGFRPFQLMVASLVGCSSSVMRKILKKKRLNVDDITVETEVTRNPDQADRIEKVVMTFHIKGEGLTEKTMDKVMELTRKNCSMVQSVVDSIEVVERYQITNN
ncbi:OsmC family protein [Tuberibacillus sp. Marseille-P3662]|uniref:OsmC family protein n=1 Tax=Tuberibacillus sp. Marseille-P3662 TaxID=1965358 RepID=UPI000A1C9866|nr:OsmC family protein [Tuberibacillus sp. Marseille-P3662]